MALPAADSGSRISRRRPPDPHGTEGPAERRPASTAGVRGSVTAPQLYLITPRIDAPVAFAPALAAACGAGDVAAVLLRLEHADERTLVNRIKALAGLVQDSGAALLVSAE